MNKIKNWRRTILCTQCDKNELQVNGKIKALNKREEKISMLQLLLATSNGLLTKSNCISDKILLLARSYLPVIQFWMDENKDGGLILNEDSNKILRDFSRTARCGEVAQGINYIIAKRVQIFNLHSCELYIQKVFNHFHSVGCKYRFGVKLYSINRTFIMLYTHYTIIITSCRYVKTIRQTFLVNHK